MRRKTIIHFDTIDVVIMSVAIAVVCTIAGYRLEQYVRSEQVASMVRASYALDQARFENERLELLLPVMQSVYGNKTPNIEVSHD